MAKGRLSIVIPVYNEAGTILAVIDRVLAAPLPDGLEREIVVVDDCSTDGTADRLAAVRDDSVKMFRHPVNRGKGAALQTGFSKVTGDYVLVQDADLEYNPDEYPVLLRPLLDGRADVVFGSRFLAASERRVLYFRHYIGNQLLTFFSNLLTDINLTDMETCYKVFRADVLKKITLREERFGFEPEITAKVSRLGCRIYEVGVSYSGRTYAEGKKIGWKDGFRAVLCIIRYNLFR